MSIYPKSKQLGAKDSSISTEPIKPITISTHVPMCFGFAARGTDKKTLVNGGHAVGLYGLKTFDRRQPYFKHTTRLLEVALGNGNPSMFKRIIPSDNDTISNMTLYVDIVKDDSVPVYTRNSDGSIAYDGSDDPIVASTTTGYKLKLISEVTDELVTTSIGQKSIKTGYMTGSIGGTPSDSQLIPVAEFRSLFQGLDYNNDGITITLPTSDEVDANIQNGNFSLPFSLGIMNRADVNSTGVALKNLSGSDAVQFALKPNSVNDLSGLGVTLPEVLATWSNLTDKSKGTVYPTVGKVHMYDANLKTIIDKLFAEEKAFAFADVTLSDATTGNTTDWLDFDPTNDIELQSWLVNPFSAMSTNNVPAFTYYMDETVVTLDATHKDVNLGINTPIYLGGGKDGTLSESELYAGIRTYMAEYIDVNSIVQDTAINLENVTYDTGVDLVTKQSMVNFISLRKDTFLTLGTYINGTDHSIDDHRAVGSVLKTTLMLAPESAKFSTGVSRALIIVGSGQDLTDPGKARYPLSMHIADKAAKMMGGVKWDADLLFDSGGKNTFTNFVNIEPVAVPALMQGELYSLGMIWPSNYDHETSFIQAMKTVYDSDRSALGNFFMGMALTINVKVTDAIHRKYGGNMSMTNAQFLETITVAANEDMDVFDGVIDAVVKYQLTDSDLVNGYSWTGETDLAGSTMKIVQEHNSNVVSKG